jgi:hypothetical protein
MPTSFDPVTNFRINVETPHPEGPSTTALTFTGIGSGILGEPMFAIDARAPVLIDNCDFDNRLRRRSRPRGLLVLVLAAGVEELGSFGGERRVVE